MSYAFPIERPLPYGAWDTCHGPMNYGASQTAQYQTRWIAWVGTNGIRFRKWTPGVLLNDVDGQADDLFPPGTRPAHLSFSFEQDALHALAIQTGSDTCEVRRKVSGVPTAYVFSGRSPVLFYNGVVVADVADTDLVCFYIKAAGDKIYVRRQRDNFGIEYVLNVTINARLRALQKTDAINLGGLNRQILWALSTTGQQVYYMSGGYPPFPQYAEDRLAVTVGLDEGVYYPSVILAFASGDAAAFDTGFEAGSYTGLTVHANAGADAGTFDTAFEAGTYRAAIVGATAPGGDSVTTDSAFVAGTYSLIVIGSTAPGDAVSIDTGFEAGTYTI